MSNSVQLQLKTPLCRLAIFGLDVDDMTWRTHTALKRWPRFRSFFDKLMELGDLAGLRGAGHNFPSKDPKSNGAFDKLAGDINLKLEALELKEIAYGNSATSETALAMVHEVRVETPAWAIARDWWGAAKNAAASVPF